MSVFKMANLLYINSADIKLESFTSPKLSDASLHFFRD